MSKWSQHVLLLCTVAVAACGSPADGPPEEAAPTSDLNPPVEAITPSVKCATDLGQFGGLRWQVRSQELSGPGPNVWNACNAWLATDGLHLRLERVGGAWTSAEVFTTDLVGYGRLEFEIATPLDALDPNVVLGLFTYPGGTLDGLHEIDIEFSRFGVATAGAANLNYVVYPGSPPKGARGQCAQRWDSSTPASIHRFLWSPTDVRFQSFVTTSIFSNTVPHRSWRFVPSGTFTISSGAWPLHLNLWLYGGKAPLNGQPVEVVIRRVTHSTSLPTTPAPSTTCQ
ncbi:MAG: glycoside hydrolase family 16 protein [Gemmatimonadaceae bacterium]